MFSRISRVLAVTILIGAGSPPLLRAQQSAEQSAQTRPKKVPTPEQRAYQEQYRQWADAHRALQAQAKQVLDKVNAIENAKDCPDANSNYDFTTCFGSLMDRDDRNLATLEKIIHDLQVPPPAMPGEGAKPAVGIAGPALTSTQLSSEFDTVEQAWRQYRTAACTAAFHQFDGGTGGPSFQAECELKLIRNHIHELDMIYGMALHL